MVDMRWNDRQITDEALSIFKQIPSRASDRGLHVVDSSSIILLALWSLLLWERKIGRVALERVGVDPYDLARDVDTLLETKAREQPVVFDQDLNVPVLAKTGEPYEPGDFHALLEPLLQQAEHEARELGHSYLGSEHLVMAMVRNADEPLSALFEQHGIGHAQLKEAVLRLLTHQD